MKVTPHPAPSLGLRLLSILVAMVVGILSANALADTADLPDVRTAAELWHNGYLAIVLRMLCGLLVGLLALALMRTLLLALMTVPGLLARTTGKPSPIVSGILIVCGTLCFLGATALEWHAISSSATSASMEAMAKIVSSEGRYGMVRTSVAPHLMAVAVFLAGVAVSALGVWSAFGCDSSGTAGVQPAARTEGPTGSV